MGWKTHVLSLTLCLCLLVVNDMTKAQSLGFPPSCAAVIPHIPLPPSLSRSKPAMWAPRSSCRGPSGGRGRWCWTWRWSRSTTSSTSEAAPSYAWRYLSRSTRSEGPTWTFIAPETIKLLPSADSSPSFVYFSNHYVIINKDTSDKDSAKSHSWWESIPVLESPPWFNGHWAFMAAIWTLDTEGYLWCTISDILYLENEGNYPRRVSVYTQYSFPQLSANFHPFR